MSQPLFSRKNLSLVLIVVMPVLALYQVSFGIFAMKHDMMNQFFPFRYFISECLNDGVLPFWCPYINFGYPFHADPQAGVFYPFATFISLFVGYTVWVVQLEYIFHLIVAGFGFYLLLRSFNLSHTVCLVLGITYSLSGPFISNAQHLTWIISLAWMPFILLYFKETIENPSVQSVIKLALVLWLEITGGYIGILIIGSYFFVGYLIFYFFLFVSRKQIHKSGKMLWWFLLSAGIFLLLAGGYLWSFGESLLYIARSNPVTLEQANDVPLSPKAALSFLFPFAIHSDSYKLDTDSSMANVYVGFLLVPLLFITFLKTKLHPFQKALFVFGILCLLASLGKFFYVRTWLYEFFPGLNMLRHAAIFRIFAVIGFLAVIPSGLEWWRHNLNAKAMQKVLAGWFIVLISILVYCSFIGKGVQPPPFFFDSLSTVKFHLDANVFEHIVVQAAYQILLIIGIIVVAVSSRFSMRFKTGLISFCMILDVALAAQLNISETVISKVKVSNLQKMLDQQPLHFPIPPLQSIGSFSEYGNESTSPIWYNFSLFQKIPAKDGFNSFYLSENEAFNNSASRGEWLEKPIAFWNSPSNLLEIKKFAPGEVIINYTIQSDDTLTLLQSMYKGWLVSINGVRTPIIKQNNYFMSCSVPKGSGEVRFTYKRSDVTLLFFLSYSIAMLLLLYLAWLNFKKLSAN